MKRGFSKLGLMLGASIVGLVILLATCRYFMRERPLVFPSDERRDLSALTWMDPKGQKQSIQNYRGQIVVFHVWNTERGYRMKRLKEMAELQRKANGVFSVITVATDPKGQAALQAFFQENSDLKLEASTPVQASSFVASLGGLVYLPTTFILDRKGKLRESLGPKSGRKASEALEEALKEQG